MDVKYVEFQIRASGFGCVNTNGNINPKTGREGSDDGLKNRIFSKIRGGKLYISSNCIRGYFFEEDARGMMLSGQAGYNNNDGGRGELVVSKRDIPQVSQRLAGSYLGLVRGYMLTEKGAESIKRSSPLMVTDWINQNGEPNCNEVMVNHVAVDEEGKKESNSLFYQDTWGDTFYEGLAVLSIENLQFIALDNRLGHQSVRFSQSPKKAAVNDEITGFMATLIGHLQKTGARNGMSEETCQRIEAQYGLYIKSGALFSYPEEGILLNNEAIHALVLETKRRFEQFTIAKAKGFVRVEYVQTGLSTAMIGDSIKTSLTGENIPEYSCFYEEYVLGVAEA